MKNPILESALKEISQDTKFIRLATITTFVHSVIFLIYISYWISNVLSKGGNNEIVETVLDMTSFVTDINIWILLIIGIPILIGYSVLPPIGEGAMIYYLNNPRKQGTASFGKGLTKFLQMFEFDAAITFFNIIIFLVAISRIYVMDIGGNFLIITAMLMWFIVILLAAFLLPYTRFFIALENMKFFNAMKESMHMAIQHFGITFKYIIVDAILHLRFILNIVIVFGIPLGLMYVGNRMGITDNGFVQTIFIILIVVLFLVTAYINGIIEAFFVTYRYKVYKHIKQEEAEDEAAIEQGEIGSELASVKEESQQIPQQVIINQYVVQPGATPPGQHPGTYQGQQNQGNTYQYNGQQVITPDSEQTIYQQAPQPIPQATPQQIPLPPEAQQYIQQPQVPQQSITKENTVATNAVSDKKIDEEEELV